jgi:hypothetical protein
LTSAAAAPARTSFDGTWSVTIKTESGSCDPAYRYAVEIADGNVAANAKESSGLVNISGKVEANGQVKVSVRRGEQHADGAGRLSEKGGIGTWTGKSATTACSGQWEAQRTG